MRGTAADTLAKIQTMLPDGSSRKTSSIDYVARKATSPGSIKNQSVKDALKDARQEIKDAWQEGAAEGKKEKGLEKITKNKRYSVALRLSAYGGILGLDRLYLGRYGTGILKLYTLGGLGVWWLIDLHNLIQGKTLTNRGLAFEDIGDVKANRRKVWLAYFVIVPVYTAWSVFVAIIAALS